MKRRIAGRIGGAVARDDHARAVDGDRLHRVQHLVCGEGIAGRKIDADMARAKRCGGLRPAYRNGRCREHFEKVVGDAEPVGRGEQRLRADAGLENDQLCGLFAEIFDQALHEGRIDIRYFRERRRMNRHAALPCDEFDHLPAEPAFEDRHFLVAHVR